MCRDATDRERRTPRLERLHATALPTLAFFVDGPAWLNATVTALLLLGALSIGVSLLLNAGRRLRWLRRGQTLQLKRLFRVTFGGLFLSAITFPYLLVEVPMVAASLIVFALLVSIPYLLQIPRHLDQRDRTTGEHADVDG